MTLVEQQQLFAYNIAKLIQWIIDASEGEEWVTLGDAYRSAAKAEEYADANKGIVNSLHRIRLAMDLNLFVNGIYQPNSEAYRHIGVYWKTLHPLNRWGGDFSNPDGNHFSSEYNGVK